MFFWLHQYWWSSRFTIFSSFSHRDPFYSFFSRWWMCRLWWCHVLQMATAQQHAAARRDEEKMHSAAASTCSPAAKLCSGQIHWCLEMQREGKGLLLCSQLTWTARVSRKWNFKAVKMVISLVLGYLGVQTNMLKSWHEFSSSQTRLWSVTDTCRTYCMGKRTAGTIWSRSWKKFTKLLHDRSTWSTELLSL